VIEYDKYYGMTYLIDEIFNYNDPLEPTNTDEEIFRKVNGPEKAQRLRYGTRKGNEYTEIADIWWTMSWAGTTPASYLTCPDAIWDGKFLQDFSGLLDVRRDYCGWW